MYAHHMHRWRSQFPREQFLLFYSDEFYEYTATVLADALKFIGLDSSLIRLHEIVQTKHNTAAGAGEQTAPRRPKFQKKMAKSFRSMH